MKTKRSSVFYCFSPFVMASTFVIEAVAAGFVLYRYRRSKISWTIVAMLVLLAAFQLAEYFVCTNSTIATASARAGYAAITFLPPLGLYLMSLLTKAMSAKAVRFMCAASLVVAGYFLLAPNSFNAYECTGNYVIFQIGGWQTIVYSIFYFGLIAVTVVKGVSFLKSSPRTKLAPAVKWLLVGYALFIVPVAVLVVFSPDTSEALPSVLCGFAVTMALVLVIRVAPLSLTRR